MPTKKSKKNKGAGPSKCKPEYCRAIIEFFDVGPYTEYVYESRPLPNKLPTFFRFAKSIGVNQDTVVDWTRKYSEFLRAYNAAKEIQKEFLITIGRAGATPPASYLFTAKNITDMRDKVETDLEVIPKYKRIHALRRKAPSTLAREEFSYKCILARFNGNLQDVTRKGIEEWMADMREAGASASTANNVFALLSNMFMKAYQWGYITHDPTEGVEKFKATVKRKRFVTPEEFRRSMPELALHLKPIIRAKLYLALRTRNLLDLRWDQVDFERELITIPQTKNGEELSQPMIQPLKELLNDLPRKSSYVFCDEQGRPYKRISKGFRSACRRAGIQDFRPHDIRRTFGTHLIANGCDIKTLQELLGHKTLKMTLLYVQSLPEIKRNSMKIRRTL